jgi:hypothetical protein
VQRKNRLIVDKNNIQFSLKETFVLKIFSGELSPKNEASPIEMSSMQLPKAVRK